MRSDEATWAQLWGILEENDLDQIVYGYRVDQFGRAIKPYLFRWLGHSWLIENIQKEYGPGDYRLLIRKGRVMIFSGYISIGPAPGSSWSQRFGSSI